MTGRTRRPSQQRKQDRPRGVQARKSGPYARTTKAAGALVCTGCGAVQHGGRWSWGKPPLAERTAGLCPACRRIRDGIPAGTLRLGPAFLEHRGEIRRMIRNLERTEKAEHPLERLMAIDEADDRLIVTTTGIHLAREISRALARRFHKKPHVRYADDEKRVRVELQ
jgi:hypothetical protein